MKLEQMIKIGMIIILGMVLIVALSSTMGWVVAIIGTLAVVSLFQLLRTMANERNPLLAMQDRIRESCAVQNIKLGRLKSLGGYTQHEGKTKEINTIHQSINYGQIVGFTVLQNNAKKLKEYYVFAVRSTGIKGKPFFRLFFKPDLFAVTPDQLLTTDFSSGLDINIKGTSWRNTEGIFFLNDLNYSPDDDIDVIKEHAERITLGGFMAQMPQLIDNATDANSAFRIARKLKDDQI